jgi:alpha-L-rhamnosidase
MRTGSRYEDKWMIPGASQVRSVQNHEYIEGRFGELIFNDTSITSADFSVGAWVVRQRYQNPASMNSSNEHLNAVFELCRYTSEATSLDLYADSNARQRSADCMADDNVAMRLAYATSGSLALQQFMMKQALTLCGTGKLGAGTCRAEWTVLPLIMVRDHM